MGKRLTDLFVVGKEVVFEDPAGDIVVWLQKINPNQIEQAFAKANAARAKIYTVRYLDEDSAEKEVYRAELDRVYPEREDRIALIAADEISKALQSAEAKIAAEEEWSNDSYLTGLQEAWENDAQHKVNTDDEDEASRRVFEELKRYNQQVEQEFDALRKGILREYQSKTDEWITSKAVEALIEIAGDQAWVSEFRKCEIWLATRQPHDHRLLYFTDRSEVDQLSMTVLNRLLNEYQLLSVDTVTGKD